MYLVSLFDVDQLSNQARDWHAFCESLMPIYNELAQKNQFNAVAVVHVFYGTTLTDELRHLVDVTPPFDVHTAFEVRYAVGMEPAQVYKQEDSNGDVLHIETYLNNALGIEETKFLKALPLVRHRSVAVFVILAVNLLIMVLTAIYGGIGDLPTLLAFGALENTLVFEQGEYYRLLTCMFLHADLMHFLFNSLSLYIFGVRIEKALGISALLLIYFSSGIVGSLAMLFFTTSVSVGASGGIYGLLGAAVAYTAFTKKRIGNLSFYTTLLFVGSGMLFGMLQPNVGNAAHLGGLVCGFFVTLVLLFFARKHEKLFYH